MQDPSPTDKRFVVHLTAAEFTVAPGQSLSIPVLIYNQGTEDEALTLSFRGVPSNWLSVPAPLIHLAPGEQREVLLTVQPPAFPHGHAGQHHLVLRVASQHDPDQVVERTCTLTVAVREVPGRIGVLLAATEFSVAPGGRVAIPLVLLNHGLEADTFALGVDGIPMGWVYAPSATVSLSPGQQQEVSLTVQPPLSDQTQAGRHPFRIRVNSQGTPGQGVEAECVLTIATVTLFGGELRPQRIEAGQTAHILVENQGNIQQAFAVTLQSPGSDLLFEPEGAQQVRVPPGQVGSLEFRARPRSRPLMGGERTLPFIARVQAPDRQVKNLNGEVLTRGWLPTWVLPAVGIAILALLAVAVLVAVLGGGGDAAPTRVPATDAPPAGETGIPPTDAPPEVPTEVPPEATPEPPVEEPAPTEPPPSGGGLLPWPAALGLPLSPGPVRANI